MSVRRLEYKDQYELDEIYGVSYFCETDPEGNKEKRDADPEKSREDFEKYNQENRIGSFTDDGKLMAIMTVVPFDIIHDGKVVPTHNVGGVATFPEHRRGGQVRKLFDHAFAEMRDQGAYFSCLMPFSYAYYRMFGYAHIYSVSDYEFKVEGLKHFAQTGGRIERYNKDKHIPDIKQIYSAYIQGKNQAVVRTEQRWDRNTRYIGTKHKSYAYIYYNDNNVPEGYVVVGHHDNALRTYEIAYTGTTALNRMLGFLYMFDSRAEKVTVTMPSYFDLARYVPEQNFVTTKTLPKWMCRIVDVKKVLEATKYATPEVDVAIEVTDKQFADNCGIWQIRSNGTETEVKLDNTLTPDMTTDIASLTQLAVGFTNADELSMFGTIDIRSESAKNLFGMKPIFVNDFI